MKKQVLAIALSSAALLGAAALPQTAAAQTDVGDLCESLIGSDTQTINTALVRLTIDTCKNADVDPTCQQNTTITRLGGLANIRLDTCGL